MHPPLILHHYENSPYAEKVRLMFGLSELHWHSVLSPVQPPRPILDPLTGGYRRIPVVQQGADLFCDTALIAQELVAQTGQSSLDIKAIDAATQALVEHAEKDVFFAAIGAVPPRRLLSTIVRQFGPLGALRFVRDRTGMMKGGTVRPAQGTKAKAVMRSFLETLEAHLQNQAWVAGDTTTIADFAVFHPLWLHVSCDRRPLKTGARTLDWYERVSNIGHGQREESNADFAFGAARESEPRSLPESVSETAFPLESGVHVAPSDYGRDPVTGSLVAFTDNRIVVARETSDFGRLHVHFPRAGYTITPA